MTGRRRALTDRGGIVSLEAALLVGLVLVPLLGAAADFGLVLAAWAAVTRAEQAALFYAFSNGVSIGGIESAAQAAYGTLTAAPTVTAGSACYCLPSSQPWSRNGAATTSCTGTCAAGDTLTEFLTVSVSAAVTLPLPLPGLASPFPVAATATARLQ